MATPPASTGAKPRQYVYVLRLVPRLFEDSGWTADDGAAVSRHLEYLRTAADKGQVLLAGRTSEPKDKTFGIVVFEAADDAAARSFMESDPTLPAGVMTAELHPYSVSVLRKE